MLPTLPMIDIITKWKNVLVADTPLNDFCLAKYGRKPHIYVGVDLRNPPSEDEPELFPYIVLLPGPKTEGLNQSVYTYTPTVGWVVMQENTTVEGDVTFYDGLTEADEMGQLIFAAVAEANPDYPVTQLDVKSTGFAIAPQYAGTFDATISIPITMGVELEY